MSPDQDRQSPSTAPRSHRRLPLPPRAEIRTTGTQVHGVTLRDDYGWLRANNWKDVLREPDVLPADIRSYLEAENAYCKALMAPTRALQKELVKEMRGRIKEDDSSVPQPDGPFLYYSRYRKGGEHPLICRKPRPAAHEEAADLAARPVRQGEESRRPVPRNPAPARPERGQRRPDRDDGERVIGLGDHVPQFLLRPVRAPSS